jgi:hypothetical protein
VSVSIGFVGRNQRTASQRWLTKLLAVAGAFLVMARVYANDDAQCPDIPAKFPTAHVSETQMRELVTAVSKPPDFHCRPFGPHQLQCDSNTVPEIWILTEPGHPAHPAASRGELLTNGHMTCIVRDGYFAGDERAFADWLNDLERYDEQAIARTRAHK